MVSGRAAREKAMTEKDLWWRAMWAVHDMCMYGVTRLETFRRLVSYGLDRRTAAELIQSHEREPT
jgi:hypothetical protein